VTYTVGTASSSHTQCRLVHTRRVRPSETNEERSAHQSRGRTGSSPLTWDKTCMVWCAESVRGGCGANHTR